MLSWVQECEEMRRACTNLPGEGIQGGISGRLRDRLIRLKIGLQAVCTRNPADAVAEDSAFTRMQACQEAARLKELEERVRTLSAETERVCQLEADNRFLREELRCRSAEFRQRQASATSVAGTQTILLETSSSVCACA